MLSLEVGDFPEGRFHIWIVLKNTRWRGGFVEVL